MGFAYERCAACNEDAAGEEVCTCSETISSAPFFGAEQLTRRRKCTRFRTDEGGCNRPEYYCCRADSVCDLVFESSRSGVLRLKIYERRECDCNSDDGHDCGSQECEARVIASRTRQPPAKNKPQ